MEITMYRRNFQKRFNQLNHITPMTIVKSVSRKEGIIKGTKHLPKSDIKRQIIKLDAKMREAAERLDFEQAIQLRDAIAELNKALEKKMENDALTPEN
jgi:excinuclease ABC subunit B